MISTRIAVGIDLIVIVVLLSHAAIPFAQNASPLVTRKPAGYDYSLITDEDIQSMRRDIRYQGKQVIAANMSLTETEAEKFWPVYEQYISELAKISDAKYALIKLYVQSDGVLTDAEAESAVKQWAEIDQSVAQLRMKYIPSFRKVLSSKNTARFFQLERRVQLMIDLPLASALPLVEP
jgi:Spy/CpxP family protein refolding chaperone